LPPRAPDLNPLERARANASRKFIPVKELIKQELSRLEKDFNIKILYAVESGSRAWGFASQDSDWDVRFIYLHNADWYLSINEKKDSIEQMLPNDLDISGWELRKTLKLFRKSNPPLLEWLHSPIVYFEEPVIIEDLRALLGEYFNPKACLYHYFHMAEGNFKEFLQRDMVRMKKYFYVLRPVLACQWIEKNNTIPPVEFENLVNTQLKDGDVKHEIEKLMKRKISGEELATEPRIPVLNDFLEERLGYYRNLLKDFPADRPSDNSKLDAFFRTALNKFNHGEF
jgi:uncharacterized protein